MGRILQKQHISNTIASCLLSCMSFLQGVETHDLLKIVLPDFFFICKITSSVASFLGRAELFSGTSTNQPKISNRKHYSEKSSCLGNPLLK